MPEAFIDQKEASDPLELEFQAVIVLFVLLTLCSFKKHLYVCHEFLLPTFPFLFFFPIHTPPTRNDCPRSYHHVSIYPSNDISSMKTSHNTPVIGHNPPLRYISLYILSIMKHFRMHGGTPV